MNVSGKKKDGTPGRCGQVPAAHRLFFMGGCPPDITNIGFYFFYFNSCSMILRFYCLGISFKFSNITKFCFKKLLRQADEVFFSPGEAVAFDKEKMLFYH